MSLAGRSTIKNRLHQHSSLGYRQPTPEAIKVPVWPLGSAALRLPSRLVSEIQIGSSCNRTNHRRQSKAATPLPRRQPDDLPEAGREMCR